MKASNLLVSVILQLFPSIDLFSFPYRESEANALPLGESILHSLAATHQDREGVMRPSARRRGRNQGRCYGKGGGPGRSGLGHHRQSGRGLR